MEAKNNSKFEIWRQRVAAAEGHPLGVTAYLAEQGINSSTYYHWREQVNGGRRAKSLTSKMKLPKAKKPIFLPVTVGATKMAQETYALRLPDAEWVAAVMAHLVRRLA